MPLFRVFGYRTFAVLAAAATAATVLVGVAAVPAHADTIADRIQTGLLPHALAMNETTNKLYATNETLGTVTVIDGASKAVTTIPVGKYPYELAVNEVTNKIYVTNSGSSSVSVIDGATGTTTTVPLPGNPSGIAANKLTNKVYVSTAGASGISVIDGATNAVTSLPVSGYALAVNAKTNKIYGVSSNGTQLIVLDGATNAVTTTDSVCAGVGVRGLAINDATNKVYATCPSARMIVAIDGTTNSTTSIPTGSNSYPMQLAINRSNNKVYVLSHGSASDSAVIVLDGSSNTFVSVPTGDPTFHLAVNEVTNKVYVGFPYKQGVRVFDGATNASGVLQGFIIPGPMAVDTKRNKIYVSDDSGLNTSGIVVIDGKNVPPTLTSGNPPVNGTVGTYYSSEFTAAGSLTPQFKLASGALPPGLSPSSGGGLYGIPTKPGTFTFSISASNGYSPDATSPVFTVTIKAAPITHDFNGDGKPDVLSRDANGILWLYPGDGSGGWLGPVKVGQGWNVMTSIVAPGDFNGDGKPDVIAGDTTGALWLYPGNGNGGWFPRVQIGQGWNTMSAITAAGDLSLDGNADLVARDSRGVLWLYPGNGKGGWLGTIGVGSGWYIMTAVIGPGDFNPDGYPDLLARDGDGALRLYQGQTMDYNGGPRPYYSGPTQVGNGWNDMTAIIGPGDFNGDGNLDILARDATGALWLYPSNGHGGWQPRTMVGSGWNTMNMII